MYRSLKFPSFKITPIQEMCAGDFVIFPTSHTPYEYSACRLMGCISQETKATVTRNAASLTLKSRYLWVTSPPVACLPQAGASVVKYFARV